LEDRIERLNACFAKAIARYNYPGVYRGVFQSNATSNDTWLIGAVWQTPSVWAGSWLEARIDDCFGYVKYTGAL